MVDDSKFNDQWLAQQLQQSEPYIEDNGFTDRVVERLPKQPVSELQHYVILLLVTLPSLIIVAWSFPLASLLEKLSVSISRLDYLPLLASTLVFTAVSTLAAVWAEKNDVF